MVLFALSCFGLLLFLWLAFGGPVPLKPKGYRFHAPVQRGRRSWRWRPTSGSPACRSARSRRSRRTSRPAAPTSSIQLDRSYAPLPSDAKAILRQKTLLGETYVELTPGTTAAPSRSPRGPLPTAGSRPVELDEILRAFDPQDARGVPELDAGAVAGDRPLRAGPQRRARQPRAVRRGRRDAVDILNRQQGASRG